jgi:hypothetical protein
VQEMADQQRPRCTHCQSFIGDRPGIGALSPPPRWCPGFRPHPKGIDTVVIPTPASSAS